MHEGRECKLGEVAAGLAGSFTDVLDAGGRPEAVTIRAGTGRVRVAEAAVVLHRPARHNTGEGPPAATRSRSRSPARRCRCGWW